ncbi:MULTISPECIES: helix-turn-helix transcriptional regulator [Pseudomonas]|uniref:Helix-turn-helix transcriptional regulator n=1 Tax=Pseudomonas salomonii TaxID=191391 RepID=A0A1H3F4H1_9PSED|nr:MULTISPECIES: LuxR C-terminal-related transcriptional regulator [Pseudomonas]NWF09437.1 helix-turn-helix transcriptional regulator [Pseudomonas salomonii]CRM47418.1 Bacterial regulatory proteins, luxR family [Pseudomonas sp. 58 R 3]SDX85780.1 regulatory protein, luxR family [Pseudomonas salomonii]
MINSQTLFPLIGKVITSAGSRKFTRLLHDLVLTKLHVDATYITQLRVKDADASRAEPNTISHEIQGPACMASPIGSNKQTTEVLTSELLMSECSPVHHMTDCSSVVNVGIEQALTTIPFSSQLHLKSLKNEYCYIISLYRMHADSFSTQEQITLKDFSSLLLPLVEKHINAINSQAVLDKNIAAENFVPNNANIDSLRQRFENRLMQSGLKLSNREKEICIGLLAGHTAPELADALVLKVNTVESYLKRAVIKMGIRGRHSLIRWMHANPGAAKVASW